MSASLFPSRPSRRALLLAFVGLVPACAFEETKSGPRGPGGSAVVTLAPLAGRWCAPRTQVGTWTLDADGGRGELVLGEHEVTADWTFGEAMIAVTRRVDGLVFERQAWRLDADAGLVERTIETPDAPGVEQRALVVASPLDDLQALRDEARWDDALVREDVARGCDRLPSSYGHGYPAAEGWYVAGATEAGTDAVTAVGWYGHGGDEAGAPFAPERSRSITLRYDEDERMVEERLERGASDGGPHDLLRERAFDGGDLVIDRMERWSPTPKEDVVRIMRFTTFGIMLLRRTLEDTWETALETRWIPAPRH